MYIYDASRVPSQLITVDPAKTPFENAGLAHNLALKRNNDLMNLIGFDADAVSVGRLVCNLAQQAEQNQSLPLGSTQIITDLVAKYLGSADINQAINHVKKSFEDTAADPVLKNTALVSALSVFYYSTEYWSYAVDTWEYVNGPCGQPIPNRTQTSISNKPKWWKTCLLDLGGALAGAELGISVGTALAPGLGTAFCAGLGALIGGAAASVYGSTL